jgi:lysophospholipase L1-like esterase
VTRRSSRPPNVSSRRLLAALVVCAGACLAACDAQPPADDPGAGGGGPGGAAAGGAAGSGSTGAGTGGVITGGGTGGRTADAGTGVPDAGAGTGGTMGGGIDAGPGRPDAGVDTGTGNGAGGRGGAAGVGAGGRTGAGGATGPLPPVTVYIAGDSTVMTYPPTAANMQAGWGQFLRDQYTAQVTVSNQSIGGRTSRRFIEEGRLTTILDTIKTGDYLMVQFGTNDGNTTALYPDGEPYLVSTADFQGFMLQFIQGARGKGAIPVLVTPPPRRSCAGDSHSFGNGLAGYSAAMKTVATQTGAALVDLNAKTLAYVNMIGCIASADFFLLGDGTHFQVNGARLMAGFVADGVREAGLALAGYAR